MVLKGIVVVLVVTTARHNSALRVPAKAGPHRGGPIADSDAIP